VVALKAYLEGEKLLRAGRPAAAKDAFRLSVAADSQFALGYYRLSVAADLNAERDMALGAAESAVRFGSRLSERERGLLSAYYARLAGRLTDAERLYRRVVAGYPEDVEGWLGMGELLFEANPLRGLSVQGARGSFEQVLAHDSLNVRALLYLARIAALDRDTARADSLLGKVATGYGLSGHKARPVFAIHDRPNVPSLERFGMIGRQHHGSTEIADVPVHLADLLRTQTIGRELTAASADCETVGAGHRLLAEVALATGKPKVASAHLEASVSCDAAAALELRTFFAALPFVPLTQMQLADLRSALHQPPVDDAGTGPEFQARTRVYGLGIVAIRQGDTVEAGHRRQELQELVDSTRAGELAMSLAASLRARVALQQGRKAQALAILERARWDRAAASSVIEVADRYLRAMLLQEVGRTDEAIGWYRSLAERASFELVAVAPAQYQLAQIYERRREPAEAVRRYDRFLALWTDADPALKPFLTHARRRLDVLGRF
jgi:tetratricopeptide (TPR) repeat protein